jgi:hypothetical protein
VTAALVICVLCGFITGNLTGVWFLAQRVVLAARARADHAAACLVEQQAENEELRHQVRELAVSQQGTIRQLEASNAQVKETRKQVRALKRAAKTPAKTPPARKRSRS